jgi:hypothetical protein
MVYADKTQYLYNMLKSKDTYVLSRPGRFGKTLAADTLDHILTGHKDLFENLWIHGSDYLWEPQPVIRLTLLAVSGENYDKLNSSMMVWLRIAAERHKLKIKGKDPVSAFRSFVTDLHKRSGRKAAVIIDGYDSPLLYSAADPDMAVTIGNRLASFYSVLEEVKGCRGFVFMTGVSRFAKRVILSRVDIGKDPDFPDEFGAICGFTPEELDTRLRESLEEALPVFIRKGRLPRGASLDDFKTALIGWYGGYTFDGRTMIINPWSLSRCLKEEIFGNYWYEHGTPYFLQETVKRNRQDFRCFNGENPLPGFSAVTDMDGVSPLSLMLQAGYLTVRAENDPGSPPLSLRCPNREVKASLRHLLARDSVGSVGEDEMPKRTSANLNWMIRSFFAHDAEGFSKSFRSVLSDMPLALDLPADLMYQTSFFSMMIARGHKMFGDEPEDSDDSEDDDGIPSLRFTSPSGDLFIFKMTHSDRAGKGGGDAGRGTDRLLKEMLDRIKVRESYRMYRGGGFRIWKAAIVISGIIDVAAAFEEAFD